MRTAFVAGLLVACGLGGACSSGGAPARHVDEDATVAAQDAATMDAAVVDAVSVDIGPHDADVLVDQCVPATIPVAGFQEDQVVVETSHSECAAQVCMVFRLHGNPTCEMFTDPRCSSAAAPNPCWSGAESLCVVVQDPGRVQIEAPSPDRSFCTCRCGAAGDPTLPLCACAAGYRCLPDSEPGGGYCVPTALLIQARICETDADCDTLDHTGTCILSTHHCDP